MEFGHITAECETQNPSSAQGMQKSGMVYEETFYEPDFEGNWAQRHHYAIQLRMRSWDEIAS